MFNMPTNSKGGCGMGWAVLRRSLTAGFILGVAICFANAPRETAGASLAAIRLVPDVASPQPVGTTITWSVSNSSPDIWKYRLRLGLEDEPLRVMYDFSPRLTFPWTPIENGRYTVLLTAHNPVTGAV